MFTGIIEEIGSVHVISRRENSAMLTISARKILKDISNGDSIAVNGVCLTVSSFSQSTFCADVMHETLNRSTLGRLKTGSSVNLERAMPASGRFGGHIVSGHIDGTGIITNIQRDDNALWYTIEAGHEILRLVIEKGSIAIDGISLTVAAVYENSFSVSIIPHTAAKTILSSKKPGEAVNLENDCIGKYIAHLLEASSEINATSVSNTGLRRNCGQQHKKAEITSDFLAKYGF